MSTFMQPYCLLLNSWHVDSISSKDEGSSTRARQGKWWFYQRLCETVCNPDSAFTTLLYRLLILQTNVRVPAAVGSKSSDKKDEEH